MNAIGHDTPQNNKKQNNSEQENLMHGICFDTLSKKADILKHILKTPPETTLD